MKAEFGEDAHVEVQLRIGVERAGDIFERYGDGAADVGADQHARAENIAVRRNQFLAGGFQFFGPGARFRRFRRRIFRFCGRAREQGERAGEDCDMFEFHNLLTVF